VEQRSYTVEEIAAMIREEYQTWHGSYAPIVRVALTHLLMRIEADANL
jgi:hypothetical protein